MEITKKSTANLIKHFFDTDGWKYDYDEERSIFRTGMSMGSIGKLDIMIPIREDYYLVHAIFSSNAEESQYVRVSEYLHRANYGLNNGNFEMDFEDGEIRYKTYVNFDGLQLSEEVVRDSILIPIFMFDTYGKNLVRLMIGESDPKTLIDEVEEEKREEREARRAESNN